MDIGKNIKINYGIKLQLEEYMLQSIYIETAYILSLFNYGSYFNERDIQAYF